MLFTKKHKELLLNRYIKQYHTQEECIGFIDGMNAVIKLIREQEKQQEAIDKLNTFIDDFNEQDPI